MSQREKIQQTLLLVEQIYTVSLTIIFGGMVRYGRRQQRKIGRPSSNDIDEKTDLDFESEVKKSKLVKETEVLKTSEIKSELETYSLGKCAPFGIKCEFSSLTKLIRVTAIVLRFIRRLKNPKSGKGPLTSSELKEAETIWVTYIQRKNVYEAILYKKANNLQK